MTCMLHRDIIAATVCYPVPDTTIADLSSLVGVGDTIRRDSPDMPLRVLAMCDIQSWLGHRFVRATCRLPDGENESLLDLHVVNGALMTPNSPSAWRGGWWLPVTVVHRQNRQLDMFGGAA